jgi:hypothetical protein
MTRRLAMVVLAFVLTAPANVGQFPSRPPRPDSVQSPHDERVVRLVIEYDDAFVSQHGAAAEDVIREAVALHNIEWRRYRREWFEIDLVRGQTSDERDASYVLAKFLHRTVSAANTIHVLMTGAPLEVYTTGTHATAIGGLAYRGSDALVISATPGVTAPLIAYYLFHELGHCWDAYDIPFGGGDTTYGSKTRTTYRVDAGNEEIIEDSPGPRPRDTRHRAPALLREKLARARVVAKETRSYVPLHDLLLYEPSPANSAYMAKKQELLAHAGSERKAIASLLHRYELTPRHAREDQTFREQLAAHYWRANDAIADRNYDVAEQELAAIQSLAESMPDVHLLVGAVEKKIRKRR